ncbi:MAG: apolipoprotein N-acyltransferase [Bacteroidales bacterium]|nr:apolipoprotein N-acyltransferase [Bacteroidales bacterium]
MHKIKLLLLSLLSGVILTLAWPPHGFPFLIFFAFIPIFFISEKLENEETKMPLLKGIAYTFPGLLIWNILTTWWIWNSTPEGSIATFILNAFFMSIFFGIWQWFRSTKPPKTTIPLALISLWMTWEYLHLNWDLTWPWLNLGNVFSPCTEWVQWYEYTGAFGGTLWIFVVNILIFNTIKFFGKAERKKIITLATGTFLTIFVPMTISQIMYKTYDLSKANPIEAVIVQQNTDPWEEEYVLSNVDQTIRLLQVANPVTTEHTELIICPESSIPHDIMEDELLTKTYQPETYKYFGFVILDSFIAQRPQLNFILGLSTMRQYDSKATETARKAGPKNLYKDYFNTSALYDKNGCEAVYHKSKLVPGVEKMPFPQVFGFLEEYAVNLGGISGSLGVDSAPKSFEVTTSQGVIKIGAPICYESAYGEHFAKFVRDGAVLMSVITNDGWWKETPGHRQHFLFSKLRAVETRRTIMRAANTGISAFIDEKGDVHQATKYGERVAIRQEVFPNERTTFYVKHGDYLAKIAIFINFGVILFGIYLRIARKRQGVGKGSAERAA